MPRPPGAPPPGAFAHNEDGSGLSQRPVLPGPPPLPDKGPKPRWPVFAAVALGLLSTVLFQVPAILLRPINPGTSGKVWLPWLVAGVTFAAIMVVAFVIRLSRTRTGIAIVVTLCVWLLICAVGLVAVRDSVVNRDADFSSALIGSVDEGYDKCRLPALNGSFVVYVLDNKESSWHTGDGVPFKEKFSDGTVAPSANLYSTNFVVEWDREEVVQSSGNDTVFGPDVSSTGDNPDITAAAEQVGPSDRCGHLSWADPSVPWKYSTRAAFFEQPIYITTSICHQAIPVLKLQVLATDEIDCDLERELAKARLRFDPDYDVYR